MDVNVLIHQTLTGIITPTVPAYYEDPELSILPSEYIVYRRIYGDERGFAGNEAKQKYHVYRISYYGTSKARRETVMEAINSVMKAAGFYLQEDNIPIPREAGAKYWGAYSEFTYWDVVT